MTTTRIVTGHDSAGHADIVLSGALPDGSFRHTPGFSVELVWQTAPGRPIDARPADAVARIESVIPAPGGSVAMVVTFPPDSHATEPGFDPQAAGEEFAARMPGLAETFEADGSGFHRSDTIDYGVVLDGEIVLDLDQGRTRRLRKGDVIVQVGTRHAWRNPGNAPAKLFFVLTGAQR